jgi:hypothetical protein
MDRTVKFLLGLIAFSLISLNLQLAGFELVGEAKAQYGSSVQLNGVERRLDKIAKFICEASKSGTERMHCM